MDNWLTIDWAATFVPKMPLPEILVRSVALYVALLVLLRVIPKRNAGQASITDMLFVVLIAGVTVEGIIKEAQAIPDFFLILLTIFLCSYAVDVLSFRYPWFQRLVEEPPTCLIRDGQILRENLRKELITEEELKSHLRRQDVDDLAKVKEAQLESDGEISVVKKPDDTDSGECETSLDEEQAGVRRANGRPPRGTSSEDAEVAAFLAAARKLEEKIADHERRAAAYRAALARYGVRPVRGKNGRASGAGRETASPGGSP